MTENAQLGEGRLNQDDEGLPSLPQGWCWTTMRELSAQESNSLAIGPFGSNLKTSDYTSSGVPLVFVRNIRSNIFGGDSTHFVSIEKAAELKAHAVSAGDVLVTKMGDPPGDATIYPEGQADGIITADCIKVKANKKVCSPRYLTYAINSQWVRKQVLEITKGVAQQKVSLGRFSAVRIPLAPPSEQNRIVEKLEELLSDLDAGVTALERARANLRKYRAAVLNAAVTGELTADWRAAHPNMEPATKLLDRILSERRQKWEDDYPGKFEARGTAPTKGWQSKYPDWPSLDTRDLTQLPVGWCWARVNQVGEVQLGRQRSPKHHHGPYMRPYLRVANVFENRIDTDDVLQMNFTPAEYEVYRLGFGDILLNEGQSLHLVGRPAMYRDEVPGACFQNTLVRFRATPGLLPKFALYVFLAYLQNKRFQKIARWTVNIAHLGADRFSNIEFPLPPIDEQQEIVAEVEQQLSEIEATENYIAASLKRSGRLRQSILKEAFAGRLVPQDPNDEPASVLIESIRQKQPSQNGKPKPRTRNSRQRELFE